MLSYYYQLGENGGWVERGFNYSLLLCLHNWVFSWRIKVMEEDSSFGEPVQFDLLELEEGSGFG